MCWVLDKVEGFFWGVVVYLKEKKRKKWNTHYQIILKTFFVWILCAGEPWVSNKKIYLEIRKKDILIYQVDIIYDKLTSRMIPAQVSEMFLFQKVDNRVC